MTESVVRVVDVYLYRSNALSAEDEPRFGLLRRAAGHTYDGSWRMVGGAIETGEAAWQTALREVREETGWTPQRLWTIPSMNAFYEWQHDRVNLIPAFAAAIAPDDAAGGPTLDDEHDAFAWLAPEAAADRLAWPEQQRLLRLAAQLLRTNIPPELVVDVP